MPPSAESPELESLDSTAAALQRRARREHVRERLARPSHTATPESERSFALRSAADDDCTVRWHTATAALLPAPEPHPTLPTTTGDRRVVAMSPAN